MKKEFVETEVKDSGVEGDFCFLVLKNKFGKTPKPGQFVMLEPLNPKSCIPRPFSIIHADNEEIVLMIKAVGENSRLYYKLRKFNRVRIFGPLGQPFILSDADECIFVSGGAGIAALLWQAKELADKKRSFKFLFGVKTKADKKLLKTILLIDDKRFNTISEEGKNGGTVVDLLKEELKGDEGKSIIVACGPKGMLKAVADAARKHGNKCFVSLEEIMACGVGSCKGCAIFGVDGTVKVKHVCQDGPFFDAEWVDWKKIIIPKIPALRKGRKTANLMKVVLRGGQGRKLILSSPIMLASGCSDLEPIENGYLDVSRVGAIVAKGLTLHPQVGNPMPRVCEVASGMLNSIGLENDGVEAFVKEKLPRYRQLGIPVIANINGHEISDYFQIAHILYGQPIDAAEINVSCPNLLRGGMLFGVSPKDTLRIVRGVRKILPHTFLIVKLTPNITDVIPIVEAAIRGGADAVSAINTVLGMAIDVKTRRSKIAGIMGGLSGPPIKPIGVRIVRQIRRIFPRLPIIGMGGINSAEDAAEYFMAGANAVAVGTGLFKNPKAITEIHNGLLEIMKLHGANHISDLSGSIILPE